MLRKRLSLVGSAILGLLGIIGLSGFESLINEARNRPVESVFLLGALVLLIVAFLDEIERAFGIHSEKGMQNDITEWLDALEWDAVRRRDPEPSHVYCVDATRKQARRDGSGIRDIVSEISIVRPRSGPFLWLGSRIILKKETKAIWDKQETVQQHLLLANLHSRVNLLGVDVVFDPADVEVFSMTRVLWLEAVTSQSFYEAVFAVVAAQTVVNTTLSQAQWLAQLNGDNGTPTEPVPPPVVQS